MTRVVIALIFLAGCTSQMKYSNVVRIRNVCSSDINVFIPEYVFTYLLMGLMFCLIFILKTSMMVSNMKKHSPQIKIARVILIIRLLSYHQDVKKNLGKTI